MFFAPKKGAIYLLIRAAFPKIFFKSFAICICFQEHVKSMWYLSKEILSPFSGHFERNLASFGTGQLPI